MKNILLVVFGLFTLASCKTIKEADFADVEKKQLPFPLKASVNIASFNANFPDKDFYLKDYYKIAVELQEYLSSINVLIDDEDFNVNTTQFYPDQRSYDIFKLFANSVSQGQRQDSDAMGKIVLELMSSSEKYPVIVPGFSLFKMFFAYLGVPVKKKKVVLNISGGIYDSNGNLLKTYKSEGVGTAYVAMYWGYGSDVKRKATIEAFKDALEGVVSQIALDEENLIQQLK